MTAPMTLPALPEPHLGTRLLPVTSRTACRSDRRHRVVAIGSGLGGLTATKALKRDLVSMSDAVAFLTRVTAQGAGHVHNQALLWLHVMLTAAAILIVLGLFTLLRDTGSSQECGRSSQRYGKGWG